MKKLLSWVFLPLPYVFVFIASIFKPFDPDLGWHLKYGEYFFQHLSILRENTFATDMPSYHWVNFSWGTDVLTYLFYHLGGFFGLSLAGAAVVTLTFYFFSNAFKLDFFERALLFPFLLYLEDAVIRVSFRGQLLSISLLGLLTWIVMSYERGNKKVLFVTPLLFLVWANLHGQFFIGLAIFALWMASYLLKRFFEEKRKWRLIHPELKIFMLVGLASFLTTLINPFGFGIYQETGKYIRNPLLQNIAEYLPPEDLSRIWWNDIIVGILIGVGVLLSYFRGELKGLATMSGITGVLYGLSYFIRRYSWTMYYFILPFIKSIAVFLKPDSKKGAFIGASIFSILSLLVIVLIKSPWSQYSQMSWDIYCRDYQGCSQNAAEFLRRLPNRGNLMNLYGWGGWMIWQYPDVKPSIDGRMHLWRDEKGFSAFETYYAYEQNKKDVDDSMYDTVFIPKEKPVYRRLLQLTREGRWKLVYRDDLSAIFARVKTP